MFLSVPALISWASSPRPAVLEVLDIVPPTPMITEVKEVEIEVRNVEVRQPVVKKATPTFTYGGIQYIIEGNGVLRDPNGIRWKKINVITTAYVACEEQCGSDFTKTSIGKPSMTTYGIAADPRALPYGSVLHIEGYGIFPVDDTGGAMRQSWRRRGVIHLDLRIPQRRYDGKWRSTSECNRIAREHGINGPSRSSKKPRVVLLQLD